MTENQLKLNDDKTEALLFPFSSSLKPSTVSLSDSITLGSHNIPFSDSVSNLGFILDSKLSMKKHIIKICQTAYFELKRISSIRRFLTEDATKTLVTSYILSRLDYCNCLLMGTPNSVIEPLQKIQNFAARLVLLAPRHHHSIPLLEKNCTGFPFQNVLSIKSLVRVSVVLVLLISLNLHVYTPSRTLRSSSDTRMLEIQQYKRKTHGFRTSSCPVCTSDVLQTQTENFEQQKNNSITSESPETLRVFQSMHLHYTAILLVVFSAKFCTKSEEYFPDRLILL